MLHRIVLLSFAIAALCAGASEYTLDFTGASALDAEAPVLRRAEMAASVGTVPAVAVGDTLNLKLFGDVEFAFNIVSAPPAGIAGQSFIAKDANGSASAIVDVDDGTVRIAVDDFMNLRQYVVRSSEGKTFIVEIDNSHIDGGECATCSGEVEPTEISEIPSKVVSHPVKSGTRMKLGTSGNEFPLSTQKSVIDVLVVFDQGAKAWALDTAKSNPAWVWNSIEKCAKDAVARMNEVVENSRNDDLYYFRLVGVTEVDASYDNIDQALLNAVSGSAAPFGKLPYVGTACGADVIVTFVNVDENRTSYSTGVAWGLEYGITKPYIDKYIKDYGRGYAICHIQRSFREYTMAHEVGHTMGAGHSNMNVSFDRCQTVEYSCGYHFTSGGTKYRTIMGYNRSRLDGGSGYWYAAPYFSEPAIPTNKNGVAVYEVPIGTVISNDNRRVLRESCAGVSTYVAHKIPYDWDVRFFDENGAEITGGTCFSFHTSIKLDCDAENAKIYYTTDGTTPNTSSKSCDPGDSIPITSYTPGETKILTACAVVNNTALSMRSIMLTESYVWSGESGANGNGVWKRDEARAWNDSSEVYSDGEGVVFPDIEGVESAVVTVKGAVAPASVAFTAYETEYTFDAGDDDAKITIPNANFAPIGNLTFNVPVQLEATTFTNMTGRTLTFNAPFGQTVDALSGYCTNLVTILPYGTMTVAPGAGKTQSFNTLNNQNGGFSGNATFRVGEGRVEFNGKINGGAGVIGRTKLEVGNGGELVFNMGGGTGHQMNQTSLTVEKGGVVRYNDMEHLRRTLFLSGGTIYAKRLDLMSNPGVYVADDSAIENNGGGYILFRNSDSEINVSNGKTLTLNVGTQTDNRSDTSGWGLVKKGGGTIVANNEFTHSGVTDINAGTLEVGYSSGATVYGQGWIVASNSTLRVKSGCALKVPSLTLDPTSTLSLPAASSAPLIVNGNVDLTEVKLAIQECSDLSLGVSYPLISSTGEISGLKDFIRQDWPRPADGLGWKVAVSGGVFTASIVDIADADPYIDFTTNISGLRPSIPEDTTMSAAGGLQIGSSPIVIDGLATNAVGVTLDVTIDEPTSAERTICSWVVNGNLVRCVVTNGVLDCFWSTQSHVDNSASFLTLSPGRHVINVGYKSLDDNTYGGTYVYVDGTLAYRAAGLRWSGKSVSKFTVGATAKDAPDKPYTGLVVHNFALLNESSTSPLPNMTSSGGTVEYDYFAGKPPCVFALTPDGGFETYSAILSGAFSGNYNALSVSVVASFPENATGTIVSSAVLDGYYGYSTQVEYRGNGVLAFRDNGSSSLIASVQVSADMSARHLYTLTYTNGTGYKLYLDGAEVLSNTSYYNGKNMPIINRVVFGCGYWTNWMTSYNDNPNPISNLKVYASHIALGTDDRTVSETIVQEATDYEAPEEILPPTTPAVVDVLVAYDLGAQDYVANKSQTLEAFAQIQIDLMNDVLVTNELDRFYTYRLAGVCKVNNTYTNINTAPALIAAGEGPAVSLRAAREIYGADTVTLLVDTTGATIGNSSPLNSTDNVASQHECAFSVCSIRAVDTGKQHTMIHENAHNMGCGHARAQSVINSPFEYGRGYYFNDNGTTRHTIMAYGGDNDASWYFSTASGKSRFGLKLGDADNNNARVLRETCADVAQWRANVKQYGDDLIVTDENGNEITSDCFFKENLKVTIAAPVEGAELYYTFDGSNPIVDKESWHQPSPYTFNFIGDRTFKIAYYDGEKLSPVRTIKAYKRDVVPAEGLWQTSLKYPWTVEGDTIRSYNQTKYGNQCTTPLKATIEGPKMLSFKHKSYFGGETIGGNNYSHFDVLLDDAPVLTQTECLNDWTEAKLIIPEGTHEVTFVFSQRFAMNNSQDNKDVTPGADDAVWLKDIAIGEIPEVELANKTSTSEDVEWELPSALEAKELKDGGIEVGTKGIVETLNFNTNVVVLSVLAELPEEQAGKIVTIQLSRESDNGTFYAYAYSKGNGKFSLGHGESTESVTSDIVSNWTSLHVWTIAFNSTEGIKLYCDGVEIAASDGIKWNGSLISGPLTFGFAGMKIYAVHSEFGPDAWTRTISPIVEGAALKISEIMPKPTDDLEPGLREGMDVNGLESGWVEVENTSAKWVDLKDYKFTRTNRGKKSNQADYGNFPSRLIPPYGRAIFYTSERYSNSKDKSVSAFATGKFKGKPEIFKDYGNILVWGDKVNPKKSPYVRLYYMPDASTTNVVDTVVIPSDLPEGWSIIIGDAEEGEGTRRWMCPTPTRNAKNSDTAKLTRIGPNVGPLYERPDQKKTDLASEFAAITPPAVPGTDYTVTLPINAVMNPDGTFTPRTADQIQSIKFVYRKDLDDATLVTNDIEMATKSTVENWGDQYTATIPSDYFPEAGHLMQWKVLITDGEGVEWTSPSFNNPDDGYEWYGTIVEPGELNSATLPTWHMFADEASTQEMDYDTVGNSQRRGQDKSLVPNFARVAIYDSSTSNYYDYVRIDLRGNTSANFTKKGHGLRFAKAHPLTMRDCVTGEEIKEIRKTSLISEFADPSYMRQMIAFWLWRKMGNLVPFDFPVRCNLNGKFYQLAFNSERFTDELIEDVYGLDKFGYSYKNVGKLKSDTSGDTTYGTSAGGIEKKTPDDENESDISVLQNELRYKIRAAQNVSGTSSAALSSSTTDATGLENAELTKFVVQKFDLPAWLNYLASAKITQEMDDVWANICIYYDNPDMLDGARGTGTWMPLGYDFNVSFGQYYQGDIGSKIGLMSNQDWFKSHPFYGGNRVRCWKQAGMTQLCNEGNDGFEAVWQSAKFRRLYLRRLRTLMDQELKEPGTPESEVPFMVKMREMADLMRADSELDLATWPDDNSDNAIDVWPSGKRPANMDAGTTEIWNDYVVPRREHLYVTHSVTNTSKAIGYGSNLNAGIPEAQSPIATLAPNISIANLTALDAEQAEALGVEGQFYGTEVVVIRNDNDEVVDMSGWKLAFSVDFTFPAGTVCDANDSIYIVADRRTYIETHDTELTDQVIVGNATFAGTGPIALYAGDGTLVYAAIPQTNELKYLRLHSFYGNTLDGGDADEWFTLTNISDSVMLDLADVTVCFLKQGDDHDTTDHCHVTLTNKKGKGDVNPLKSWTAQQADYSDMGWLKIQNNKQQITIYDKYGSVCQSLMVTQKTFPLAYGNGGYLVCDSVAASVTKDSDWHEALYELANDGASSENFSAEDQAAANELVANAKPVLSDDDIVAGLDAQYLTIVAEPVADEEGKYKAVVAVDPETVSAPVIAEPAAESEPVEIEEDDKGETTVSVSISNAVKGLWYGYEVSDELGESAVFDNDVDSFERATGSAHTITGSPRTEPSGFFRVKVLPAKPKSSN